MKKKQTIQQKLTKSYFLLVIILLVLTGGLILPAQLQEFNTSLEENISWTGYLLAQNTELIQAAKSGSLPRSLQDSLADIIQTSEDIDYIVLADTSSTRIYHPDAAEIGQPFIGDDQQQILSDAAPYITTSQGRRDVQKRSFHQITDQDGTVLGFIMVSASMENVHAAQYRLVGKFLLIFGILFVLGMLFAFYTAKKIRHSLLGYEPDTFAKMFLQREEILDNLDEGILAYNSSRKNLYSNPSARNLLGEHIDLSTNQTVLPLLDSCLKGKRTYAGLPLECNGNSLLFSLIPLCNQDEVIGSLVMVRDRTEAIQLAEQLTGTTHIVDALRASTHEYLNKLHIISGMLQMENYEQAITFIDGVANETRNGYQTVIRQIQNKTIAALLLGKQSHSRELDIDFTLQKDSFLEPHNEFLSTQELVTIVGNLVENAFHAVVDNNALRQVSLYISQTPQGLTIVCDDTGCGITEDQIQQILSGHFTTRGEGHGVGLRLIQEIVKKHHGYLTIESEVGTGSSFTISIQEKFR